MDYRARNFDKQGFEVLANAIITAYNEVILTYRVIQKVGKKMDGKVLNARFSNAINDELKSKDMPTSVYMSDPYNMGHKELKIYTSNRDVKIGENWVYFDKDLHGLMIYNCNNFLNGENRIISEKLDQECETEISLCKQQQEKWGDARDNYDKYTEQVNNAIKQLGEAMKGLNGFFRPSQISSYDWENAYK